MAATSCSGTPATTPSPPETGSSTSLTVEPATADAGKAVVAGLGNQAAACNVAYSVEGVRFGLTPVPLLVGEAGVPDLLRNRIAYRMFGAALTDRTGSLMLTLK